MGFTRCAGAGKQRCRSTHATAAELGVTHEGSGALLGGARDLPERVCVRFGSLEKHRAEPETAFRSCWSYSLAVEVSREADPSEGWACVCLKLLFLSLMRKSWDQWQAIPTDGRDTGGVPLGYCGGLGQLCVQRCAGPAARSWIPLRWLYTVVTQLGASSWRR